MPVLAYENGKITIQCGHCLRESTVDISKEEIRFNEEFGEYYPMAVFCAPCEEDGRESAEFVNTNLPEFDEMEPEVMDGLAPPEECTARRAIRDLIWDKRPDLRKKSRDEELEKFIEQKRSKRGR